MGIKKNGIAALRQAAKFMRKGQADGHEPFSIELYARSPAPVYLARHGEAAPFPMIPHIFRVPELPYATKTGEQKDRA